MVPPFARSGRATGACARALAYAANGAVRRRWLDALVSLIAIPSVSATPAHRADVLRAAAHLAALARRAGLDVALESVRGGAPHVVGRRHGSGGPALLAYGHYDVQPAGGGWHTDPFAPVVRGGKLYGRGASDDKGQLFIHLAAMEAYAAAGAPPLDLTVWFEGEEEIGSPSAPFFLDRRLAALRADTVVVCDTEMASAQRPSLVYGLRGSVVLDAVVSGPARDLHSGRYGGAIANPVHGLAALVASLHDDNGRVAVEAFYDDVRDVPPEERVRLLDGPDDAAIADEAGVAPVAGESGFSAYERTAIRPALIVTGIASGARGAGAKASIPARASARITARLVPEQDPVAIAHAVRAHLAARVPPGLRLDLSLRGASPAVVLPAGDPALAAAARALRATYGAWPALLRSGGSIPLVGQLHRRLDAPVVLMGFGLPGDAIHGPNERLDLAQFLRGVETMIRFYAELAEVAR
jgi:acetylornithine deacetylase/succinyl-diaminopimelate desuccinylase-like protein